MALQADPNASLTGKVALVTGGSRGMGAAIAKRLAADGASVAITYSKGADAAASVVKEIEHGGGKAIAIQADAADAEAVRNAVERTVTTLGRLDVLVNNAGTAIPKPFLRYRTTSIAHKQHCRSYRMPCRLADSHAELADKLRYQRWEERQWTGCTEKWLSSPAVLRA